MRRRKSGTAAIVFLLFLIIAVLFAGFTAVYHFNGEIEIYEDSLANADAAFEIYTPQPFINSAVNIEPIRNDNNHEDALYFFEVPEGFTMISHSEAWNEEMLERLYHELLLNRHGDEINLLHEVIVYPLEETEMNALASFTLSTAVTSLLLQFPAFPEDFTIDFPEDIGKINLYGGNTKTTIESMAESLSHEYGHLYTFYYMFNSERVGGDTLAGTEYARLREATRFGLITNSSPGDTYLQERHRYLIEIAAEDYVQLMGSPTTRRVVDFVDVQQIVNGASHPPGMSGARNAFPQENMMIPLANDVTGLREYFFSFIDAEPWEPIEEKKEITIQISAPNVVQRDLTTGPRTLVHYVITWNAPYENAIYTLACYDPDDYSGWGIPIKTVRHGQPTTAVIGAYSILQGNRVPIADDGLPQGTKVFYVVAMLPDGTYYMSEKLAVEFS